MIVILEGPNKCGKTTLARHLIKNYGFAYFKDTRIETRELTNEQKKEVIEHDIEAQANLLKAIANDINLIVDRFHITEFVYGSLNRGYESNCVKIAEEMLKDANVKIIYLSRYNNSVDELGVMYDEVFNNTKIPYLEFDIKNSKIELLNKYLGLEYTEEIQMDEGKCII